MPSAQRKDYEPLGSTLSRDDNALQIVRGDDRFVMLHAARRGPMRFGSLRTDARVCVATFQEDALRSLCMANGTRCEYGDFVLTRETPGNAYAERKPDDTGRQ